MAATWVGRNPGRSRARRPLQASESERMVCMSMHDLARQFGFVAVPMAQARAELPEPVAVALPESEVVVFACLDEYSDTAAFSERYGVGLDDCANTLILKYSRQQGEHYAAAATLGSRRLDVNGAVKQRLGAKRLSMARREIATEITGMQFGGITVFGVPEGMRILIDESVMTRRFVIMGAGRRDRKLLLAPSTLARLPLVEIGPMALPAA